MIRAVILDLDNTLYEYQPAHKKAIESLAAWAKQKKGIDPQEFYHQYKLAQDYVKFHTKNQAASHNRFLYLQRICEIFQWNPIEYTEMLYDIYWNNFYRQMVLDGDVFVLFNRLKELNIKIAICTELTANVQHRKIKYLGVQEYIDVLVTSEEAGSEKNSDIIFSLTLDKLGIKANEAIFIGDNYEKDYLGAKRNGLKSYVFTKYNKEDKVHINSNNRINSLLKVLECL